MLFNYLTMQQYEINISEILHAIEGDRTKIDNYRFADFFIDSWKDILYNLYLSLPCDSETFRKQATDFAIANQNQLFQKTIKFSSFDMFLHFSIDKAYERTSEAETFHMPLSRFGEPDGVIEYSTTDDVSLGYASLTEPVIIVPYATLDYKWLVIDGNHRITAKKKYGESVVDVKVLSKVQAMETLPNEFEQAYYSFLFEITGLVDFNSL